MTTSSYLLLSALVLVLASPTAWSSSPPAAEGIHVRLEGVTPFAADAAAMALKAAKAQCESPQIKAMCAMPHVAADKAGGAKLCAAVSGGFKFKGDLAGVGMTEADVYFWPAKRMSARYGKARVLKAKQLCDYEVVEEETAKIVHHAPGGGGVRYELHNHPKKGVYWTLVKSPTLGSEIFSLLKGRVPFADPSKVSPVLGHDLIAGHKCEIREFSDPWTIRLCQSSTGKSFPEQVTLAAKTVSGKDIMLDERATRVAMNVVLPASLFVPPSGARIENVDAKSTDNATQKWCGKQKARTGVDPCEDGLDHGGR